MGEFKHDMTAEKRPPVLLPEGHRVVRVTEMISGVSKSSGNSMFTATIEDVKSKKSMQVYLVAEPKKRWMLKNLLTACQVKAGEDGVYDWSVDEVIGKTVVAVIEHFQEPWINTKGESVTNTKAKVTEFYYAAPGADGTIKPEDIAWEE